MKLVHVNFFGYTFLRKQEYVTKKKKRCRDIFDSSNCKGLGGEKMQGQIYKVLEDTRDNVTPNICSSCGGFIRPIVASTTERYSICVYECKQCGAVSFLLSEIYRENE